MNSETRNLSEDLDEIIIIDDNDTIGEQIKTETWKMIIVDDDIEVHHITKLVLRDFEFEGKHLSFLSAYSGAEAIQLIKDNPDTAVILLDVIMEKSDAGLNVIKYIRNELGNKIVRIILRTGQPGETPEEETIISYDINDYKEKSELTSKKLLTSVITALRSFRDLIVLQNNKLSLERIINSSYVIHRQKTLNNFINEILSQLLYLLYEGKKYVNNYYSGLAAMMDGDEFVIVSGVEDYANVNGRYLKDVLSQEEFENVLETLQAEGIVCKGKYFIACFKNEAITPVIVFVRCKNDLTEWEQDLLAIYYTNAFIALDNFMLTNEIESTQKEIVLTLGGISEARSKETGNHVKRVAEYSKILALGYNLKEEEVEILKQASPMHDIGKLAIPDAILNKPGKLTAEEFDVIKTHSQIGYDMLKNSNRSLMKVASIIALQHHEKFDGTGYPQRLQGENIHIYGRITAVADVFDALGSERVYKKAWDLDRIIELFKEERGKHFDPELIDIFFDNLSKIIQVKDSLADI
ncbi:MAG: DUF3369 domain-containing protein [Clostridia bacterium]|nr:DUF3369 domain-containing protein [Clostridia bacterium]